MSNNIYNIVGIKRAAVEANFNHECIGHVIVGLRLTMNGSQDVFLFLGKIKSNEKY